MSKVEGRGPIDPPRLMPSCNFFRLMLSRVNVVYIEVKQSTRDVNISIILLRAE